MIQQTVFGLGIFTKEASARFRYRGPPGSDVPGSDNYSMISDSFARNTLREACSAVHDSLEFDEAVEAARSSESKVPRAVIGPVSRPGARQISFLAYSSLEKGKAGEGNAEPKPRRFLGYLLQVAPADVPAIQQKGDDAEEPPQEEVQRLAIERHHHQHQPQQR